jgi:hypothetical protein
MDKADRTPKDELDEEELVNHVKPLIEEGHRILDECNGSLRGLDPDGSIAARAKGRASSREATPEEYRLADLLKELTQTVVKTIDDAKKKLNDMPHAKKKLNPLWGLLTEPLFQVITPCCQPFPSLTLLDTCGRWSALVWGTWACRPIAFRPRPRRTGEWAAGRAWYRQIAWWIGAWQPVWEQG